MDDDAVGGRGAMPAKVDRKTGRVEDTNPDSEVASALVEGGTIGSDLLLAAVLATGRRVISGSIISRGGESLTTSGPPFDFGRTLETLEEEGSW